MQNLGFTRRLRQRLIRCCVCAEKLQTLQGKLLALSEAADEYQCPDCHYRTKNKDTLAFHIRITHPTSQPGAEGRADPPEKVSFYPQLEIEGGDEVSKLKRLLNAEVVRRIERGELAPKDLQATSPPPSGPASLADCPSPSDDSSSKTKSGSSFSLLARGKSILRRTSVTQSSGDLPEKSEAPESSGSDKTAGSGSSATSLARRNSVFQAYSSAAADAKISAPRRSLQRSQSIRMDRASLRNLLKLDEFDELPAHRSHNSSQPAHADDKGESACEDDTEVLALTSFSINGYSFLAGAREKHNLF
jgi:hypothetical protein